MNSLDIIKNAEKQDVLELKNSVESVLSKKAFEKLDQIKRDAASQLLTPEAEGEEE